MSKSQLSAQEMVRGMGTGMHLLQLLTDEVGLQGGDPEVLAFLTRPRFKHNLTLIGAFIANCDWRIPASEMRARAKKHYERRWDSDWVEEQILSLWWMEVCFELRIPFNGYVQEPRHRYDESPIPAAVLAQLDGIPVPRSPHTVELDGERWVIVDFHTTSSTARFFNGADTINAREISRIALARCEYFDLDK